LPPDLLQGRATPLAESLRRARTLVSPHTGIVRGAEEVLASASDVRLPNVFCTTADGGALIGVPGATIGGGSGRTVEAALVAAVAEAAERYSACWSADVDVVVASAAELGPQAVLPERFALFSERQHREPGFPYARFTSDSTVAWVRGYALPDGEPALLPAQLAYLAWELRPGEQRIARSTSNGLAAHATAAEAVLSGLFEAIERDAFMISWGARLSWPRLAWPLDSALGSFAQRYLDPTGLRYAALDLSAVWNVPCVVGVVRSDVPGEAPLGVGAGAAATVERAIEKALDEAFRVRSWAGAQRSLDPAGERVPVPDEIVQFDEHVAFYARDENAARAAFLDAHAERRDVGGVAALSAHTVAGRIAELCDRLAAQHASAYCVDVTAPDVGAAGLSVMKVLAPELCPLDVEHRYRHLGGRRRRLPEHELNPDPHPFP
jgi:ribosomal protein S12 methylthiotransferase accessory factor